MLAAFLLFFVGGTVAYVSLQAPGEADIGPEGGPPPAHPPPPTPPLPPPTGWDVITVLVTATAVVIIAGVVWLVLRTHSGKPRPGTRPAGPDATATHAHPPDTDETRTARPDRPADATQTHRPGGDLAAGEADLAAVLARYRLLVHLGQGSYGTVFAAEPRDRPGDRVAVKFFVARSADRWRRLREEVDRLAAVGGVAGVVRVREVVADADPPYFVMDLAPGGSLADALRDRGPWDPAAAAALVARVAVTLAEVHRRGVVHCDLKPANVLLDAGGRPVVADFGQARLGGEAGPPLGTFFYMAPEQADGPAGGDPDPRWDVYALGALLYALVTGGPPRADAAARTELARSATPGDRLRVYARLVRTPPPPGGHRTRPGMDPDLAGVIDRCLAADPGDRYRDGGEVATALAAVAGGAVRRLA
jgi:hypothetical protein